MKKIYFILVISILTIGIISCKQQVGGINPNDIGDQYREDTTKTETNGKLHLYGDLKRLSQSCMPEEKK